MRAECEGPVPNKQKNSRLQLTEWKSSCVRPARRRLCLIILRFRWTAISSCQCRAVNELRREGLQDLEDRILQTYRRDPEAGEVIPAEEDVLLTSCSAKEEKDPGTPETVLSVSVQSAGQFTEAATMEGVGRIYVDSRIGNRPVVRSVMEKTSGEREYYLAMPYIFGKTWKRF